MYDAINPITSAELSNSMCPASLMSPRLLFQRPANESHNKTPTDDELDEHECEINREIEEDFPARFRGEDETKKLDIIDAN